MLPALRLHPQISSKRVRIHHNLTWRFDFQTISEAGYIPIKPLTNPKIQKSIKPRIIVEHNFPLKHCNQLV